MSENKIVNIENCLIIFPKYTFYLQSNGWKVLDKQDKLSNRKLNEYLMQANIAKAMNQEVELPDAVVYMDGRWRRVNMEGIKFVEFDAGKYGKYRYFPVLAEQLCSIEIMNAISCFIKQYSSAKLTIISK